MPHLKADSDIHGLGDRRMRHSLPQTQDLLQRWRARAKSENGYADQSLVHRQLGLATSPTVRLHHIQYPGPTESTYAMVLTWESIEFRRKILAPQVIKQLAINDLQTTVE